jgi:hypothetical protein
MKSSEVYQALARKLEWWRNTIVPNVYLGSRRDEMDLAIISKSGLLWEIEIKVSMADWKADMHKPKWNRGQRVLPCHPARFYYAVPTELVPEVERCEAERWGKRRYAIPDWVDSSAGVIAVEGFDCQMLRQAKPLHRSPLPLELRLELLQKLGARYWGHVAPHDQSLGTK